MCIKRLSRRIKAHWVQSQGHSLIYRVLELAVQGGRWLFARSRSRLRALLRPVFRWLDKRFAGLLVSPVSHLLVLFYRNAAHPQSVLHISLMVHVPYYTTRLLRRYGWKADYLAIGSPSKVWDKADYQFIPSAVPFLRVWREFRFFWRVVARYEIIHMHFGIGLSESGWELPILKRLDRKIVVHYRGCEARDREKNMVLHPEMNICQECDYGPNYLCKDPARLARRERGECYGDLSLVTTPDMQDFMPDTIHLPFLLPQVNYEAYRAYARQHPNPNGTFKIVHVTGHPGIEGTRHIQTAIDRLNQRGYRIAFVFLHLVPHEQVLREMATADLAIGKMKMGYYANAQIESMFMGVPAVTYVRPEFMTPALEASGFIFTTLDALEETLLYYLEHPEALEAKRAIARSSILQLHGDEMIAKRQIELYERIRQEK